MESKIEEKVYDRNVIGQKLLVSFYSSMEQLESLWHAFGMNEQSAVVRANVVLKHVSTLLTDLIKEEHTLYEHMKEKTSRYLEDLKILSAELEIEGLEQGEELTLLEKEQYLREEVNKLEKEKHARIKEYKQLAKKESELCDLLAMPKTALKYSSNSLKPKVPTKQELHELQQNIDMLIEEREQRYKKFCAAKRELTTIIEVTEFSPETSFEREILCHNDNDVVLSSENLQLITHFVNKLQQRKCELEQEKKMLSEKLTSLWDRLNIDKGERSKFLSKFNECNQSTISALKEEISRCEEIKKQNIGEYVKKLREELIDLWEKCCISEADKKFKALNSTDYTEELLDAHDREVERMKKYYTDTKEIFEKIAKRKVLWDLMLKFERKAADPNRFNNRGGNLLQEERERKKLLKDLPRLEEEILKAIGEYEENNDSIFLVHGMNFSEYIEGQWAEHMREKENEKLERQRLRTLQADTGRPSKTPAKRTLFCTPASAPSKLSRTNAGMSVLRMPTRSSRKVCTNQITPSDLYRIHGNKTRMRSPHSSQNTRTPLSRVLLKNEETPKFQNNVNDTTSYSQFAKELDKNARERCRSSVLFPSRKVLGSKISHSGTLRKSMSRSSRKSSNYSLRSSTKGNSKLLRNTSRTPTKLTPARAKLGLPFLI